jgi:hypothetical protein
MILGSDNRKKWSQMDVLVMRAYQIIEDERCQKCGYPIWICRNEDPRLQARKKVDKCWVDGELSEWRKAAKDDEAADFRAEVYARDETPLWKFRKPYYDSLEKAADEDG